MKMLIYIKDFIERGPAAAQPLFHVLHELHPGEMSSVPFDGYSIRNKCVGIVSIFKNISKKPKG